MSTNPALRALFFTKLPYLWYNHPLNMKTDIHPQYYPQAKVTCACGNTFLIGSTKSEIRVEICSNCHPFYTGAEKFIDTEGRVERFQRQVKEAKERVQTVSKHKKEIKPKKEQERPQTLKEMMELLQKQK